MRIGSYGLLMLLAVWGLAACSPFQPETRSMRPVDMPGQYSLYTAEPEQPSRWWEAFGSPELNRLVGRALSGGFTVREAWARLRQAEATAVKTGAGLYPNLTAQGTGSVSSEEREDAQGNKTNPSTEAYSLGLTASYELDLWGKIRSAREADRLSASATREELNTAAISLASEVAQRWVRILAVRQQQALLNSQLENNRTYLELIELRFTKSLATALDVLQQREVVAQTEARRPPLQAEEKTLEHELAVLLGLPPAAGLGISQKELPPPLPLPPAGLPADLLAMRPDVRAAGLRLKEADWRVSAARADRLPSISLTGRAQYSGDAVSSMFSNWLLNLAGSLTGPVFDGGRRTAEVERTRAVADERLAAYERTVFTAIREVEDALIRERKQQELIVLLTRQLEAARAALQEAGGRYLDGVSEYLQVLTELLNVQRLEQDLVQQRQNLILYRLALYKALGGAWTDRLTDARQTAADAGSPDQTN